MRSRTMLTVSTLATFAGIIPVHAQTLEAQKATSGLVIGESAPGGGKLSGTSPVYADVPSNARERLLKTAAPIKSAPTPAIETARPATSDPLSDANIGKTLSDENIEKCLGDFDTCAKDHKIVVYTTIGVAIGAFAGKFIGAVIGGLIGYVIAKS